MCVRLKKAQEQFAGKNIDVDLQVAVHGQASDDNAAKKLTKKQQKAALEERRIAKVAKLEAAKQAALANASIASEEDAVVAPKTSKKAAGKATVAQINTTLDKLLNETIGESADDDSEDEDFEAAADSTLNSTLNSSTASSSSVASSPPPAKKAKRNVQKKSKRTLSTTSASSAADESIASLPAAELSSPEPVRTKKPTSLVATGGIQKKRAAKKVASQSGPATVSQAMKKSGQLKDLIQSTVDTVTKVKATKLKQKKKAGNRA